MTRLSRSASAQISSTSAEKVRANRANSLKSTGPQTPNGRQRTSQNAVKHGVFCSLAVLKGEDQHAFNHLRARLIAEHKPQTSTELFLVERMVISMWRIDRIYAAEAATHEQFGEHMQKVRSRRECERMTPEGNMAEMLAGSPGETSVLERLHRYEKRLEGTFHRSLRELRKLRTPIKGETVPAEPSPFENQENEDLTTEVEAPDAEQSVSDAAELSSQPELGQSIISLDQILQNEPNRGPAEPEIAQMECPDASVS